MTHRLPLQNRAAGWLAAILMATAAPFALAQMPPNLPEPPHSMPDEPARFPSAAITFLSVEMPAMEAAIADRDRDYFEAAMGRVLDFSDRWGYKTRDNPQLAPYAACSDAVADYLVVGLCRFKLSAETCQPELQREFDGKFQRCRAMAGSR